MTISRRDFITAGLGVLGVVLSPLEIFQLAARAESGDAGQDGGKGGRGGEKVLVLVQLSGGNDGLNMVVPYGVGGYYDARPNIAVAQKDVLALDNKIGLHPNMKGLAQLYKDKKLSIVQGVGYPNPNRSHFRSIEIWQTGDPEKIAEVGWLGKYLDCKYAGKQKDSMPAVNVDAVLPKTLLASKVTVPSVNNVYDFRFRTDAQFRDDRKEQVEAFADIYSSFDLKRPYVELLRESGLEANKASDYLLKIVKSYKGQVAYPGGKLGDGLKFIAQMISGGVSSSIYTVSMDGFDTHTNQSRAQANLLKQLSDALTAFQTDLEQHGRDQSVITVVFSEFGRRVAENGGRGTDHGTAEPMLLLGSALNGGIYGDYPDLSNLDAGDLKFNVDFRSVYATILDQWLAADSVQILGRKFDGINLLA